MSLLHFIKLRKAISKGFALVLVASGI